MTFNYKKSLEFWQDFLGNLSSLNGIYLQLVGKDGIVFSKPFNQRTICLYLNRFNKTREECSKFCFKIAEKSIDDWKVHRMTCYMGVECFAVPITLENNERATIVGAKVLTHIPYKETYIALCEKLGLDFHEVLNSVSELKMMKESEIESCINMIEKFGKPSALAFAKLRELESSGIILKRSFEDLNELDNFRELSSDFYFAFLRVIANCFNLKDVSLLVMAGAIHETVMDLRDYNNKGIFSKVSISSDSDILKQLHSDECEYVFLEEAQQLEQLGIKWGAKKLHVFPLRLNKKIWGLILIYDFMASNDILKAITTYCINMEYAVERVLLREKLSGAKHQKEALKKIFEDLKKYTDINELLKTVAYHVGWLFNAQRVSIALLDQDVGRLELRAVRGIDRKISDNTRYINENSISHHVFKTGIPVVVKDIMTDETFSKMAHWGCHGSAFVSIPLRNNGSSLGVVNLSELMENTYLNQEHFQALEDVIGIAAMIIEKAICKKEVTNMNLAYIDDAVGIYNKKYFIEFVKNTIENSKRYSRNASVVILELGDEKTDIKEKIEDEMCSMITDAKKFIRVSDVVAVFDENRVAFFLPDTERNGAIVFAQKLQSKAKNMISSLNKTNISEVIKVGISTFPDDGSSFDELTFAAKNAINDNIIYQ